MSLVSIPEASKWATNYLDKEILPMNISYLVQYGKVKKHGENGSTQVDLADLKKYYESYNGKREANWKKNLGDDLNWTLSFDNLREKDTTKHVHRLHPYKGKYIPQLVEYFIDTHTDDFKKEAYFKSGDIVIVREQPTVDDGEKAVAYMPDRNEVTLKKIYGEKDRIKLVPANKYMEPFYETNVEIQGKVVGVLRKEV